MAQIITNTFFDDCEAIVNDNGIPVLDYEALANRLELLLTPNLNIPLDDDTLKRAGLSRRFINELPNSALGLYVRVPDDLSPDANNISYHCLQLNGYITDPEAKAATALNIGSRGIFGIMVGVSADGNILYTNVVKG